MNSKCVLLGLTVVVLLAGCTGPSSLTPTVTPSPTLSPGVTPSDTPRPTFTPSPTPTPEVRIETGEQALFNGDYDQALYEYQAALDTSTDSQVRAAALWGLGRDEYAVKNNGRALDIFWQLIREYPASSNAIRAYFLMGEIYLALQRYTEAAQAYTVYLALRPGVIDAYVQERRGDAYTAAGNDTEAISAYQAALAALHIEEDTALQIKIAQAYIRLGDTTTALRIYDTLFATSPDDYVKAQMDLLSGQIYLSLGQTDEAYQRFLHAVDNYPLAYDSYSALVALVNAGIPTNDMNRGLVDYFAGQYGYAIDAFQRFIDTNPQNDGTAVYYKALSFFALGQYEDAVQAWDVFIQNYLDNPHWAAAWNGSLSLPGRAFTQWYFLGQYDVAAQTLLTFVKQAPADLNAPIYLVEAGRIQERAGKLEEAAQIWDRVAVEYPGSELVPQALFWAGIAQYRLGKYNDALVAFQRDSILSTDLEAQVRAHFWIGKAQQALGDTAARATWQQTAALDATGYYSLRAQDLLFNRPAFNPVSSANLVINLAAERPEAEAWLRVSFNLPTDTDLSTPGALLVDPRLIRGTEFLTLGLDAQARLDFDDLRTSVESNPADCYRLANYLLNLGLYNPAIFAFRQVLTLAGMNTQSQTLAAPVFFNHVRYGLYYQELILPASQRAGFDPLFLLSVMRQESLYDKFAGSGQGALGLMQITPGTGQLIADNLGWPPNYTTADLYRPMVSIGLGTSFLQTQRLRFSGDLFTTLAAYNAGPNAAPVWRDLSGPDSDLFVEVIRFEETRDYIISIYEIYAMYRLLYATIP